MLEGQAGRADGSMVATDGRVDRGVVLLYLPQGPIRRGQGNEGECWVFRSEKRIRPGPAQTREGQY